METLQGKTFFSRQTQPDFLQSVLSPKPLSPPTLQPSPAPPVDFSHSLPGQFPRAAEFPVSFLAGFRCVSPSHDTAIRPVSSHTLHSMDLGAWRSQLVGVFSDATLDVRVRSGGSAWCKIRFWGLVRVPLRTCFTEDPLSAHFHKSSPKLHAVSTVHFIRLILQNLCRCLFLSHQTCRFLPPPTFLGLGPF